MVVWNKTIIINLSKVSHTQSCTNIILTWLAMKTTHCPKERWPVAHRRRYYFHNQASMAYIIVKLSFIDEPNEEHI